MGAVGLARVTAIEPCPKLEEGPGALVVAVYHHWRAIVCDLRVEGGPEPIGVTPSHPFWSVDRGNWVPVGELRPGERLLGVTGTVQVQSLTLSEKEADVYNLEIEGDHCYRVGQQGLLVHNQSIQKVSHH